MIVERSDNGGYTISQLVGGHLIRRCFLGYTRQEAEDQFSAEMRERKNRRAMTAQTTPKKAEPMDDSFEDYTVTADALAHRVLNAAIDALAMTAAATQLAPFPRQAEIDSIVTQLKTATDREERRRLKAAIYVLSYRGPAPVAKWDLLAGFPGKRSFLRRVGGGCHRIYITASADARAVMHQEEAPEWYLDTNRQAELHSGIISVPVIESNFHSGSYPVDVDELFWVMMFTKIKFSTGTHVFTARQAI